MQEKTNYGLKIAFFTPYFEQNRGNATTAKRIITGLRGVGIEVEVFSYEEKQWTKADEERLTGCSLYHILHFRRFAAWQEKNNFFLDKKYVLTSGGTDVNHDIFQSDLVSRMKNLVENACAITVFSEDGRDKVGSVFALDQKKLHVVPQSIWFPPKDDCEASTVFTEMSSPRFLLPAGLRKVKDVLFLRSALDQLKEEHNQLQFVIVGAVIEKEILDDVLKACQSSPWLTYVNEVPLSQMKGTYEAADFVVNTSISEGQPAAILEAMSLGKVVFARRNGGNESVIQHGKTGFLFDDPSQFLEQATKVLRSKSLQDKITKNAKDYIAKEHHIEQEIKTYLKIYKNCTG
ncbi:glycosyltransferase family 4 protein [Anaerobacillus sp. MEB173]|uniref:glycosyltransferase family 4 protein n=1 Tax=Anaerobacillus sp. MEB173 TaxID=3383345 RepID=UPI003F915843